MSAKPGGAPASPGPRFGRALRPLWELAEGAAFLNHGSFGACPKAVLAEQERIRRRMESAPDAFFRDEVMPDAGNTSLRRAAEALAAFLGVPGGNVGFVENATAGVQAVLRSIGFEPGDRILVTDHGYKAVRRMVEARCAETGATAVVVPIGIPADEDGIVAAFRRALDAPVRLAIVDHITSPTAIVMPLDRIVAEVRRAAALVLVDGAHGVGQLPLDLGSLDADWYVSNLHKWLFAPKGSAFLYASDAVAAQTRPHVVSNFFDLPFPRCFDYVGTRDNSAWLAVPAAIDFFRALDPQALRAYQRSLMRSCTAKLAAAGAIPAAPEGLSAAMRSFVLPQRAAATQADARELMRGLWEGERIQAAAHALCGRLLLRVSFQAYVDEDDLARLAGALGRGGWPGR